MGSPGEPDQRCRRSAVTVVGMSQHGDPPQRPPLLTARQEEFMLRAVPIDDHDPPIRTSFQKRLWAQSLTAYQGNPGSRCRFWERADKTLTLDAAGATEGQDR